MLTPNIFISYSHKDERWKDRLKNQLEVLTKQGFFNVWDDRRINAGEDWFEEIQRAMDAACVAILLISANSLTSDFILNKEVEHLLKRKKDQGMPIFPIILEPCDWQGVSWLSRMQVRPRDGHPLSSGDKHQIETNLTAIVKEVRLLLNKSKHTRIPQDPMITFSADPSPTSTVSVSTGTAVVEYDRSRLRYLRSRGPG